MANERRKNSKHPPANRATRGSRRTPAESRAQQLAAKIGEWLKDESGYDEETWPALKEALQKDRLSARSLFRGRRDVARREVTL